MGDQGGTLGWRERLTTLVEEFERVSAATMGAIIYGTYDKDARTALAADLRAALAAAAPPQEGLARVFHDVHEAIHVRRVEAGSPDSFYNGVITARGEVMRVAESYGVSARDVYHPAPPQEGGGGPRSIEVTEDEAGQQWYIGGHVADHEARHALLGYLLAEADLPSEEAWSLAGTARVSRGWYRYVRPDDDGMVPCEPDAEGATAITSLVDVVECAPAPPPTGVRVDREALRRMLADLSVELTGGFPVSYSPAAFAAFQRLAAALAPLLGSPDADGAGREAGE